MEKFINGNTLTVQGIKSPVPAASVSARAGYQSSISSACNVTPVSLARVTDNATSNDLSEDISPFVRSSVIKRTPPLSSTSEGKSDTPVNSKIEIEPKSGSDTFAELGVMIVGLMEYIKNRNNVHHAIKEKVREIRVTYNKVRDERDEISNNQETSNRATQTTPSDSRSDSKRSRDPVDAVTGLEMPKRPKTRSPRKKKHQSTENEVVMVEPAVANKTPTPVENWTTVNRRKKPRRLKPDAVIISAKGETTYADILRKIRNDPELEELGKEVNKVRRTQKGELLLELSTAHRGIADKFNEKIKTSLEGNVEVKTHREELMIECKDLDDITTKREICLAFGNALEIPNLEEAAIKSLRKAYGGTQTAKLCLPVDIASRALELNKIKIGWSVCRIREISIPTMCYRCLDFGHIAKSCKSEFDRSHHCRKCGVEGHISRNCMLCRKNGGTDLNHTAGSYRCPVFKKALQAKHK